MEDHRSSFLAIVPRLTNGLFQAAFRRKATRNFLRGVLAEAKFYAGRIREVSEPPFTQQSFVASYARAIGARSVFEFGTGSGANAMAIARECPDCSVWTLDVPEEIELNFEEARHRLSVEVRPDLQWGLKRGRLISGEPAERIHQLREDSGAFDAERYAGQFDLVYVDASHAYSAVKSDTDKAFTLVKPTGTIIWDDYIWPGVWLYLNDLSAARPDLELKLVKEANKVLLRVSPDSPAGASIK